MTQGVRIRESGDEDLAAIRRLLDRNALPTADLAISRPIFFVACDGPALVGAAGLEVLGTAGLLRSLVVDDARRGTGLGRMLVEYIERAAARRGVTELLLLTTTARDYFASLGYADIARDAAPEAVRQSAEFRALCPRSASCMHKRIAGQGARPSGEAPVRVLFLCTGNSARSILAEAILNQRGGGRIRGFSAGSRPRGQIHPMALALLQRQKVPSGNLRSKGWEEFARPGAEPMDHVVTVCDSAAAEACPVWPGRPATEHWSIPDPANVEGPEEERRRAFESAFSTLQERIAALMQRLEAGRAST